MDRRDHPQGHAPGRGAGLFRLPLLVCGEMRRILLMRNKIGRVLAWTPPERYRLPLGKLAIISIAGIIYFLLLALVSNQG
jgi:hypothetical protein